LALAESSSCVTVSRQDVPTGSISHVIHVNVCTSRRGGSISMFSPAAMSNSPGTLDL
jgi:hypothetical protein